jgi:uncharacterized protein
MIPDLAMRLAAREPDGRRPTVMHHRWESLLFLHWRLPPARIQRTLPEALTVDTYNGEAFLGITPFFMRNVRPVGMPAIPGLSNFQELNVRTYAFDRAGVPGVWFYSLDCNQRLAVAGARALTGLPYFNAAMKSSIVDFINYSCQRNGAAEAAEYRYRGIGSTAQADPGSLEFFLLERYYLFSVRHRSLIRAQVSHHPYNFRQAEVPFYSTLPATWNRFGELAGRPHHQCFVHGLDVKIFATQKVTHSSRPKLVS